MTGEVEVQVFAPGTLSDFDVVHDLCWRDRLAADVAGLIAAFSGKQTCGSSLRKCARSNPCSNLLPQQLAVRLLWAVGRYHGISDHRTATGASLVVCKRGSSRLCKR